METFPAYVAILLSGFSIKRESTNQRTPMEDGFIKQTKFKSRALVKRNIVARLSSLADYQAFILWFQTNIDDGADWFNWTDPVDGVVKTARIVDGLSDETPVTNTLTHWDVSLQIETWGS